MSRRSSKSVVEFPGKSPGDTHKAPTLEECLLLLGVGESVETLPFTQGDVTAGSESELQAAVLGRRDVVDLPLTITRSRYLADVEKRIRTGDTSQSLARGLDEYLSQNPEEIWENSWVRFPKELLAPAARAAFHHDLRAERSNPLSAPRSDAERFVIEEGGRELVRIPISYLLNLSLIDALADEPTPGGAVLSPAVRSTGLELVSRFLNDNTSPETSSLHVVHATPPGRQLAHESAKRFLLTHLLVAYANEKLGLRRDGQVAVVFPSPHTPHRQKLLNRNISDAFYRELFISPCLPWEDGEGKQQYMALCHQALSRSQMNAIAKLCDSGILVNNLALLPRGSDTSLANNGTHVSLGSRKVAALLESGSGFGPAHEKYLGDLVIKVLEHFLPLFVGTYSAAPCRLAFHEFHPERLLGFLPHQLDYTHLRMIWRRWKKKAKNNVLNHPVTPFGPPWIDRATSWLFRLRGDFVPDFRLMDYPVALMSTEESPALDGRMGNVERLKRDLGELGVFDPMMSLYLPIKLREHRQMGFSGFEFRTHSQFTSFHEDLAPATDLKLLLTVLALKYVSGQAGEAVTHFHVPDRPELESERRQIFFAAAVNLPTFYVRSDTPNFFLKKVLELTRGTRPSRRYRGYLRIKVREYQRALLRLIERDASDLVEMFGLEETLLDLRMRIDDPDNCSAAGKLTRAILDRAGERSPFGMPAEQFNAAAESYYRQDLRHRMLSEGIRALADDLGRVQAGEVRASSPALPREIVLRSRDEVVEERLNADQLRYLVHLLVWTEHVERHGDVSYEHAAGLGEAS